ncbi:MAG TPA: YceI family protein [Rudaea sp.]|nr:YceI family protein [Rudaea sp.]
MTLRNRSMAAVFLLAAATAHAGGADYRFDTVHTQVFFAVSHLGFSHPNGRMHVKSGFFHFDPDDWSSARVDALVDVASLDMGDGAWNDKLRSSEFFATDRYPTARFVSTSVEKTGDRAATVHGKLTLHGVARPLDLTVTFNRAGIHPYSLHYVAGFSATATLKRSQFGMDRLLPDVGDEVSVRIEAEGLRDGNAAVQAQRPDEEH